MDNVDDIIDGEVPLPTNPRQKWYKRVIISSGVSDPRKIELLGSMLKSMVAHGKRDRSIRKKAVDIMKNYGEHIERIPDNHPFIIDEKTGKARHPMSGDKGKDLKITPPVQHTHSKRKKGVAPHDYFGEMRAIQKWVQDNIRYIFDPRDVEYFQTPRRTMIDGAGDCDDLSILTSSLLESIGYTTSICLCNPRGKGTAVSHAMCAVKFPREQKIKLGGNEIKFRTDKWYLVETIQPRQFGWIPPKADKFIYVKIK
jgi:hypothetical protein